MLVLDEPTNNLDVESVDALAEGLKEYKGGLVLVTHDVRLLTYVDCEVWICGEPELNIS